MSRKESIAMLGGLLCIVATRIGTCHMTEAEALIARWPLAIAGIVLVAFSIYRIEKRNNDRFH